MHENALEHSDAYDASQVQLESAYEQIRILRNGIVNSSTADGCRVMFMSARNHFLFAWERASIFNFPFKRIHRLVL